MSLNGTHATLVADAPITKSSYSIAADGFMTQSAYKAAEAACGVIGLGSQSGPRARGAIIDPLLTDAEDETAALKIWAVSPYLKGDKKGFIVRLLATVDLIAGSLSYAAGTLADGTAYLACDTLTLTASAYAGAQADALGSSIGVDSPADNTPGRILIPDAYGAFALLLDSDVGTAAGFNALAEVMT